MAILIRTITPVTYRPHPPGKVTIAMELDTSGHAQSRGGCKSLFHAVCKPVGCTGEKVTIFTGGFWLLCWPPAALGQLKMILKVKLLH